MTRVATSWYHTQRLLAVRRWGRGYRAGRPTDVTGLDLAANAQVPEVTELVVVRTSDRGPAARSVIELDAFRANIQRAER